MGDNHAALETVGQEMTEDSNRSLTGNDMEKRSPDLDATIVSVARTIEDSSQRVAALVVVKGPEIGRLYPLRRNKVVLGRGDKADILLRTREVSRRHARIDCIRIGEESIYRLVDLDSTNQVYVNGEIVQDCRLEDDDKIHLGDVVLKFEMLDLIDSRFHEEIRNRIRFDDLTGLLTYESFQTALTWELDRNANEVKGCAVVMMDLDDFKKLNDSYGHLAGSHVLHEIGELIRTKFRQFDVSARYGGEEFVAFLPVTDAKEAFTASERVRVLIERGIFLHKERDLRITISMGISHFPDDGRELDQLIQAADERLYRAKREGKNRICTS